MARIVFYALWFLLVTLSADAHAGPVLAVIGAISAAVAKGGLVALLIKGALTAALSLASSLLQKALAKKQRPAGVKLEVEMGDDLPVSTTIGTYATSGKRKYIGTHGAAGKTPNAFLVDVIELGNLPVSGLNGLWIDDEECEILWNEAHADYGAPIKNFRKNGVDFAWVRFRDGTGTTADAYLRAKFGADEDRPWKDTMIGRGCPAAIMTYRFNQNLWSGLPQPIFEPGPIRLYDVSKDSTAGGDGGQRWSNPATWQPSDNLMVMAYNVIRGLYYNGTWFFGGRNLAAHRLPASAWIAAIVEAGRLVGTYNGATEPQFRAGYEITGDMEPLGVLEDLRDAGAARIAEVGGSFKPAIGAYGAAVYAFTDDDIVITKGQTLDPFPTLDDTYNGVTALFPYPKEKWATKDAPPQYRPDLEAKDRDRRLLAELRLPACPFKRQVQQVARSMILEHRRFRKHQFYLPPDAWVLEPNDVVTWTSARNGYVNKRFVVAAIEGEPSLNQMVTLRELDPNDYDWSSDFEVPVSTGTIKRYVVPTQLMGAFTVTAVPLVDNAGVPRRVAIRVAADAEVDDVAAIAAQVKLSGAGDDEILFNRSDLRWETPYSWVLGDSYIPGVTYLVRAKYIPGTKRDTAWSAWTPVSTPSVLFKTEDIAEAAVKAAQIAFSAVLQDKIGPYAVTADKLANEAADARVLANRAVTELKIALGAVTLPAFANGIRPVEVVSTLPTTGNSEGRTVYLIATGKLYRYTGSAWTSAVLAADVVGEIVSTQIGPGAITTPKLAALSVEAGNLAANSVIFGKVAAGAIRSDELAVNSVTGKHFVLTDFSNLVPDNQMMTADVWTGSGWELWSDHALFRSYNGFRFSAGPWGSGGYSDALTGVAFPVKGGVSYRVGGQSYANNNFNCLLRVWWLDGAGATISVYDFLNTGPVAAGRHDADVSLVAPANAVTARIQAYVQRDNTTGPVYVGGFFVNEKNAASLTVDGSITGNLIAGETITGVNVYGKTLTGDKVAFNTLTGLHLVTDAITARTLVLTDFSNMADNGWQRGDLAGWSLGGQQGWYEGNDKGDASGWVYISNARNQAQSSFVNVTPGETYYAEAWVYNYAPEAAQLLFVFTDQAGGNPGWPGVAYTDVKEAWTRLSGIITVPAGKTRMALLLQVNKASTGGPSTEWSKPVLRRAAAAELIVDGAVITSKLQAGAVVTDKLQVGAATIDKLAPNAATQIVNRANAGEYTYTTAGDKLTGESAINITMGSGDAALIRGAVRVRQSAAGTTECSLKLYVNGNLVDEDFATLNVVGRRVYLSVDYLSTTPGAKEVNLIMTISSITGECKRSRYFLTVINFRKGILLV